MLKKNMQFAVHAPTAGYVDLTQWVTDFNVTPSVDIASRELVGRGYMWHAATMSYLEGQLDGYVLQTPTDNLISIFEGNENAVWAIRYPNGRIIAFNSFVPDSAITNDSGIQVLDVPLQSTGGYITGKGSTEIGVSNVQTITNMPANAYIFYWIREEITGLTQLDFIFRYAGDGAKDIEIDTFPRTRGLHIEAIGNTEVFPTANFSIGFTGAAENNQIEWVIGELK